MLKMKQLPSYKKALVADLIPYARNSRTHSDEQVTKIAASIKEFGFLNPVIVDGENGIIAGHGRVMAAKKLGLDEVPVIEATHLTDAQRRDKRWVQVSQMMSGGNKGKSGASIKKSGKSVVSGSGYGGHHRAVQGFKMQRALAV